MRRNSAATLIRSPTRTRSAVTGETRMRGLIDTNVVIHLAALDGSGLPDEMVISAVTLAELSAGPHHTSDPTERARRMSVLQHTESTFEPLPFRSEEHTSELQSLRHLV